MEKAELLRDADVNLLPALLRLQELVRKFSLCLFCSIVLRETQVLPQVSPISAAFCPHEILSFIFLLLSDSVKFSCLCQVEDNVTVVLLSEIVWDKFRPNTGCLEPLLIHFPDYSKG